MRTVLLLAACLSVLAASLACRDARPPDENAHQSDVDPAEIAGDEVVLSFGVVTRAEPRLTVAGSQPLIDYLDDATPYRVELRMGRSSEDFELDEGMQDLVTFLEERLVDIAPLGVLTYCLADERFGAVALVQSLNDDGEPLERAAFIVAASSGVRELAELEGKRVAIGPSHSMVSHVLAAHTLASTGISASTSGLESDRAIMDAVARGDYDAGVVSERAVDDSVRVISLSIAIPSRPLVVRADLPEPVQSSLRAALLALDRETTSGWDPIFENGFAPSRDDDYVPIRRMLNEQGVRCAGSCHEPVRFRGDE